MTKNHMADVAKMLGVKLNEKFWLQSVFTSRKYSDIYILKEDGLWHKEDLKEYFYHKVLSNTLSEILEGKYMILKIPKQEAIK